MKFKTDIDKAKITKSLYMVCQIVPEIIKDTLKNAGYKIKQEGEGVNMRFNIKVHDYEAVLQLHNLLFEIVTRDRDSKYLEFDKRIEDEAFFITKTMNTIESKLKVLYKLKEKKDIDRALGEIKKFSGYERMGIVRIDREKMNREKREKNNPNTK